MQEDQCVDRGGEQSPEDDKFESESDVEAEPEPRVKGGVKMIIITYPGYFYMLIIFQLRHNRVRLRLKSRTMKMKAMLAVTTTLATTLKTVDLFFLHC